MQLSLGLLRSTMLHELPLDFIWLGVMLERVGQTARTLDVHHHALSGLSTRHQVVDTAVWLSLLRACSGFEPFMKRHPGNVTGPSVAEFLILERKFPRSIRYCIQSAHERFGRIRPRTETSLPGTATEARLSALFSWIQGHASHSLDPTTIHALLTHVVDETSAICDGLSRELFGYEPTLAEEASPQ